MFCSMSVERINYNIAFDYINACIPVQLVELMVFLVLPDLMIEEEWYMCSQQRFFIFKVIIILNRFI